MIKQKQVTPMYFFFQTMKMTPLVKGMVNYFRLTSFVAVAFSV